MVWRCPVCSPLPSAHRLLAGLGLHSISSWFEGADQSPEGLDGLENRAGVQHLLLSGEPHCGTFHLPSSWRLRPTP